MSIHAVVIQKLLSTNAHLGRRITAHHFTPFIYGSRNSLSIIDSDKTLIALRNALHFISNLLSSSPNPRFLFVNTNPLFDPIFDHMTRTLGYGSFTSKSNQYWKLGGFLTNSASPKKFKSRNKKLRFGPVHPPDCVFIVDTERKSSVVRESSKLGVPVIGLVDSSVPRETFEKITYPIPCNDSVQFVYLVCNLITKTFMLEKKKKKDLECAGSGSVSMATLRNLKVKASTCKRLVEELHSYEEEVEREAAKIVDMKEKGADPFDIKAQETVLVESRMRISDCRKRLESALADLKKILVELIESNEKEPEIDEAMSTILEVEKLLGTEDA